MTEEKVITLDNLQTFKEECDKLYTILSSINGVEINGKNIVIPTKIIDKERLEEEITIPMTSESEPYNYINASSYWGQKNSNNVLLPYKAFDNDFSTYWVAEGAGKQWIEYITDNTVYDLTKIIIRPYSSGRGMPNIEVEISSDGENYISVYQFSNKLTPDTDTTININYASDNGFNRIRISAVVPEDTLSSNYIGIREIHIYGITVAASTSSGVLVNLVNYDKNIKSYIASLTGGAGIKETLDDVLVPNVKYFLGEKMNVSLNFPDEGSLGSEITVVWYNGATPAAFSVTGANISLSPSANTRVEINALWDGVKWAVILAEEER